MNSSKFPQNVLLESSFRARDLEIMDQLNQSASPKREGITKIKMLLVTLSTTVMLAKKKPLPKEYYQWTRAYLETIRNDDGTSLPTITGLLKFIDYFENENKIQDELQNSRDELPEEEIIEASVEEEAVDESMMEDQQPIFSSTGLPARENANENNVVEDSVVSDTESIVAE